MLSLLAGPIDIVPGDPLPVSPTVRVEFGAVWLDDRGLYFVHNDMFVTHVDGKALHVGQGEYFSQLVGWSTVHNAPIIAMNTGWAPIRLPGMHRFTEWRAGRPPQGLLSDRKLNGYGHKMYSAPVDSTDLNLGTLEYTFPNPFQETLYTHTVYAGQKNGKHLWWIVDGNGRYYKYNSTDKIEAEGYVRSGFGSAIRAVAYSVKHDLFFVVRGGASTPHQLYVYATEPEAQTLSVPTVTPTLRRGGRSKVTTKLTGSYGEACGDRSVTFSTNYGTVYPTTVLTGKDGVATTYLYASVADTAATTITATAD